MTARPSCAIGASEWAYVLDKSACLTWALPTRRRYRDAGLAGVFATPRFCRHEAAADFATIKFQT